MESMTPEEFEEAQEAAAEDELDHTIETFDTAAQWNVYVAATEANAAASEATSANIQLNDWEHLSKGVGAALLLGLAIEGAQSALSGRGY